ncbi:MAG: helix-turn-helix domain-containing protein [Solirubrobacterales bacterium]
MAEDAVRADAERNHRLIIDAAIRILGHDPDASIQNLVDESGVGRTTFYRHFQTREDLLEAVTAEVMARARRRAAAAAIVAGEPKTSIRNLSASLLDIGLDWGPLIATRDGVSDAFETAKKADDSPTRTFLEAGRERGELRTDMPQEWLRTVVQTVVLTAIDEVARGALTRPDAYRLTADTLVSVLLPPR